MISLFASVASLLFRSFSPLAVLSLVLEGGILGFPDRTGMSQHAMTSPKHSLSFSASGLPLILMPEFFYTPPKFLQNSTYRYQSSGSARMGSTKTKFSTDSGQRVSQMKFGLNDLSLALLFRLFALKRQDLKELW